MEEEKGFSHLHSKLTEAETKLKYSRRERTDLESKVIIRQCLGSESVGSARFCLTGSGSAKILSV